MKSKDIYPALLAAGPRAADPFWLIEFIVHEVGVVCGSCGEYPQPRGHIPRAVQEPVELAMWLLWLRDRAPVINSYLEIGSSSGGTFFLTDAFLRLHNPRYETSLGIDRTRRPRGLEGYRERFPTCRWEHRSSHEWTPDRQYDVCFIDADHRERSVRRDFLLAVKAGALYVALHDINYPGIDGPRRVFEQFTAAFPNIKTEVIRSPIHREVSPGIAVVATAGLRVEEVARGLGWRAEG